jgi:fermentation-respiration switch protein FrsA (DUF1100 family)
MHRAIAFQSEGTDVQGLLYVPDGPGPFPAVVMAGGWCYVKELVQPAYAELFQAAGLVALIFDYRRLGASGGEPRQHLDPRDQVEDYRNAISFLEQLDAVDERRIGVWGISYSGGHALIVGGIDARVRCVTSVVPVVEGLETMRRAHGTMGFRRLRAAIMDSRRKRFLSGEHDYMLHSSEHPDRELCTWPFPGSPPLFRMLKQTQAPAYENRNTVASAELLLEYSVAPYVKRLIDTPTLVVLADQDDFTMWDLEVDAFNAIPTPRKRLVVIPETGHHDLYRDPAKLRLAAAACRDWLTIHLGGG